jgi:2-keto-3-deoxy-6-phosphogluconate aldolase
VRTAKSTASASSEAFAAIRAGARHLKLFPAATYGAAHLKALKSVLPADVSVYAVGGIGPAEMGNWLAAGANGFGVGGELYRPGQTAAEVAARAGAETMLRTQRASATDPSATASRTMLGWYNGRPFGSGACELALRTRHRRQRRT